MIARWSIEHGQVEAYRRQVSEYQRGLADACGRTTEVREPATEPPRAPANGSAAPGAGKARRDPLRDRRLK